MRARNIKPGFFQNESLAALEPHARLLFIGLWCLADREGLLENRPRRIQAALFPYEDVDCARLLRDLEREGFIRSYVRDGRSCLSIVNFTKHQNPHRRERPSELPRPNDTNFPHAPDETAPRQGLGREQAVPGPADSGFRIPDSPSPHPDSRRVGTRRAVVGGTVPEF